MVADVGNVPGARDGPPVIAAASWQAQPGFRGHRAARPPCVDGDHPRAADCGRAADRARFESDRGDGGATDTTEAVHRRPQQHRGVSAAVAHRGPRARRGDHLRSSSRSRAAEALCLAGEARPDAWPAFAGIEGHGTAPPPAGRPGAEGERLGRGSPRRRTTHATRFVSGTIVEPDPGERPATPAWFRGDDRKVIGTRAADVAGSGGREVSRHARSDRARRTGRRTEPNRRIATLALAARSRPTARVRSI